MNDMKLRLSSVYGSRCRDDRHDEIDKEPHYQKEYNDRILILLESILEELENIREVLEGDSHVR